MTNAAIKAVLDSEGTKVRFVKTTSHSFALNQANQGEPMITNDMVEFVSLGGIEMLKVKRWDPSSQKYYHEYILSDVVEKIVVVDNENDVLDPYSIQF